MRSAAVFLITAVLVMPAAAPSDAATESTNDVTAGASLDAAKEFGADRGKIPPEGPAVDDVFRQFGLFGIWAADCGRPPTLDNPHVSVGTPSAGVVLENNDVGPGYAANRYSVLKARRLAADRLEVTVIFRPGEQDEERQTLVFAVGKSTRRTMFNRVEGGAIRVRHGIVLSRGVKTPLLNKCG